MPPKKPKGRSKKDVDDMAVSDLTIGDRLIIDYIDLHEPRTTLGTATSVINP